MLTARVLEVMAKLIEPKVLKGFRDSLPYGPQGEKRRRRIMASLGQLFELGGFEPIDTPALELCEILLGKAGGETEKQIYRFRDNGGRDVALRFDLTVPFSRFVVQHAQDLSFPFKRYHMAKVWRGENAQRGRYREFYQCDFDIVGDSSVLSDLCVLQMAHSVMSHLQRDYPALGGLLIHVNHRGLLQAFWQLCGVAQEQRTLALRVIDKLHKVGREVVAQELEILLGPQIAQDLMNYLGSGQADFILELQRLEHLLLQLAGDLPAGAVPVLTELRQIADFAAQSGLELRFDPSIARGLDYYTGMVFEIFLEKLPSLGSVCSGGRYDRLTQLYSKNLLPGVGASIGLDRLLAGLEQLEAGSQKGQEGGGCLIICPDPEWRAADTSAHLACLRFGHDLQELGIACDVIPRVRKMSTLFQRAAMKNSRYLLLLQSDSSWQLRKLSSRESVAVSSVSEVQQQL